MARAQTKPPEGLLADVLARPDDDEARLVLADALMERGDPRGELIALQCAKVETDDGRDRAEALLAEHVDRWTEGLGPRSLTYEFRRGFVDKVFGRSDMVARHLARIRAREPVTRVHLGRIQPSSVPALVQAMLDADIRGLLLTTPPGPELTKAFASSRLAESLEELSVCWNSEDLLAVRMPRLRTLRVDVSDHEGPQERAIFALESPIEELSLEGYSSVVLRALPRSRLRATLRRLKTPRGSLDALAKLGCPALERVDVENLSRVDDRELETFARSPAPLRSFRALAGVRPNQLARLLSSIPAVESMDLSYCDLGLIGVQALVSASLPRLTELRLRFAADGTGTFVDAAAVEQLCRSDLARRLRVLDLDGNRLGDDGAVALAAAPFHALRSLHLRGCALGPRGAEALARSTSLPGLRELDLSENDLGDEGFLALATSAGLTRIARIALHGVRVGPRAGHAVKDRFGGALERELRT